VEGLNAMDTSTAMVSKLVFCAIMSASACSEDEFPLPPIVWEGEMVRVRMDDEEIPVCGGTFEALDLHAGLVREALLLEGRERIIEYSIGDRDFVEEQCGDPSAGCAFPDTGNVFVSAPIIQHEIVHAVRILDPEIKLLSSAVEEGLATVFGADFGGSGTIPLQALEILDKERVVGGPDYYRAGQVMAILLERHGIEAFRRFDVLARRTTEDSAFLEVFGETKEDFAQAAEAAPQCDPTRWRAPIFECSGAPERQDPDTGQLVLSGSLDCGAPDVIGPTSGTAWTTRHFEITKRTNELRYEFDFAEDVVLEIVGCNPGCPDRFTYSGGRWEVGSFGGIRDLEPGEYFIRMSRPISSAADDGWFEIVL